MHVRLQTFTYRLAAGIGIMKPNLPNWSKRKWCDMKPKFKVGDKLKTVTPKGEVLHAVVTGIGKSLFWSGFESKDTFIFIERDCTEAGIAKKAKRGDEHPARPVKDKIRFDGSNSCMFIWEKIGSQKRKIV